MVIFNRALALSSLACLLSFGAVAQEAKQSALDRYEGAVSFGLLSCGLTFSIAQSAADLQSSGSSIDEKTRQSADYNGCIKQNKADIKKAFDGAQGSVRKPAAKAALKDHYVAALSALQGIAPQLDERVIVYRARQSANKSAVDKAWTRFEVEN